ncbi:MAG: LysE family translocator [Geminicoccaceae bacterium]
MNDQFWLLFAFTALIASLIPGPSTLIAFAHGARHGWSKSLFTALGNATASTLQAAAASTGLGIIITSSGSLFLAIKYAGAAFLVLIGIQMWRSAAAGVKLGAEAGKTDARPSQLFASGFMVAIGNPKAIAFFTALFPQFLSPSADSFTQLALMVAVIGVVALSVASFYGCIGAWVRGLELSRRIMQRIFKATGGLFVAGGIGLAFSRNTP